MSKTSILYTTHPIDEVSRIAEDILNVPYVVEDANEFDGFEVGINVYAPADGAQLAREFEKVLKRPVYTLEELDKV